jgi:hypothetical protein
VQPKQRYATLVVNVETVGRVFTDEGRDALSACMRRHSPGVKQWSASGGHRIWTCRRIPREHADACAAEIAQALECWTKPASEGTL